jgi:DNA-binding NarL/FixJ family response regulator
MTIRLLIVDDHLVVRTGLRAMLGADPEFDVVGEATSGARAVELAGRLRPDVVLMDLRMPQVDGVAATAQIRERHPNVHVLVLTTYDTDADILRAIEAGATGYLLKDTTREELCRAVRAAAAGTSVLAPTVASRLMGHLRAPGQEALTTRSWPGGEATDRSAPRCSSARRRSRRTCCTSSASSRCRIAPRR